MLMFSIVCEIGQAGLPLCMKQAVTPGVFNFQRLENGSPGKRQRCR